MTGADLAFLSVADLARRIAARELSPVEVTTAALERCERLDPELRSFITLLPEQALAEARRAEAEIGRGEPRGPLHGVPIGIKDIFWTRGVRTTAASLVLADFVPDEDATVVERLRAAGAVMLGKNNLTEFAYGPTDYVHPEYGPVRNPWDLGRSAGGSSSGSAAAVAAGLVPGTLGSDTTGSIRHPAGLCGISGLNPSYGLVSCYGAIPVSATFDRPGPLARSAEDCALILQAIAGYDPRDPSSARVEIPDYRARLVGGVRGLRLGVPRAFFFDELWPGIREAVDAATDALRRLGAQVVPVDLPGLPEDAAAVAAIVQAEASANHRPYLQERAADYAPDNHRKLLDGLQISAVDYLDGLEARRRLQRTFDAAFRQVDALLTPTRDATASRMDENGKLLDPAPHRAAGRPSPTIPFSAAGLPAISVPCGFDPNGLPIGLQIAGPRFDDALVLRIAHAYQQATERHERRPPLSV